MRLSDRLERIAAKAAEVTEGYVADVGTDHGFVPIRLIESGKVKHVVAMDVRKGPLEKGSPVQGSRACTGISYGGPDRDTLKRWVAGAEGR